MYLEYINVNFGWYFLMLMVAIAVGFAMFFYCYVLNKTINALIALLILFVFEMIIVGGLVFLNYNKDLSAIYLEDFKNKIENINHLNRENQGQMNNLLKKIREDKIILNGEYEIFIHKIDKLYNNEKKEEYIKMILKD